VSGPDTGVRPSPSQSTEPATPAWLLWVIGHKKTSLALSLVLIAALLAVVDWPHRATQGELRTDFALYATQVRGDVQSCSVEVEQTLSAYNQIVAGVNTDRATARAIATQTALDCTPFGNSRIDDLGTIQTPSSLAAYSLAPATQQLYAWCFPGGVDVAQYIGHLLDKPGDPKLLAALKARLASMNVLATRAQSVFDEAAAALHMPPVNFGLDEVRPGVLVG